MANSVEKRILIRMEKELMDLEQSPPAGAICYPVNDNILHLKAEISGPRDTPYEGGTFKLDIHIPERYPFEPPRCQFTTRIYHPNIDDQGRICLNILKVPPNGIWGPAHNLNALLLSLIVLLDCPNPDDPLLVEVAHEFKDNIILFNQKAREITRLYASKDSEEIAAAQSETTVQSEITVSDSTSLRLRSVESSSSAVILSSPNKSSTAQPVLGLSSASLSATPCPQRSSVMKRSSSKLTLKKPSTRNNLAIDSITTTSTSAKANGLIKSSSSEVSRINSDSNEEQMKSADISVTRTTEARQQPSSTTIVDSKATRSKVICSVLDDTISSYPTNIENKKRENDTEQQEDSVVIPESTKCKKQKKEKTGSPSRLKPTSKENIPPESSSAVNEICPVTPSQLAVEKSFHSTSKMQSQSSEKSTGGILKEQDNIHSPLQPTIVSSQKNNYYASGIEYSAGEPNSIESYATDIHTKYATKLKPTEISQDGKGKGKCKDSRPREADENTSIIDGRFASTYKGMNSYMNNSTSSSLTIAQKRNLLKKNRS